MMLWGLSFLGGTFQPALHGVDRGNAASVDKFAIDHNGGRAHNALLHNLHLICHFAQGNLNTQSRSFPRDAVKRV